MTEVVEREDALLYIGGEWISPVNDEWYEAISPGTGNRLARVSKGSAEDVDRAVAAAAKAAPVMRKLPMTERMEICRRVDALLQQRVDSFGRLLSDEQGKPFELEAKLEINRTGLFWKMNAEEGFRLGGDVYTSLDANKRIMTFRQPIGVFGVITPWNFPVIIPSVYLSAGIMSGNALVWVPAPSTALCAFELARLVQEAGLPPGALNVVSGPGPVVGDALARHPDVPSVGLTGSPLTGAAVSQSAAGKPLLLELGGNGPNIILPDADLDRAADALCKCAYLNAGQICTATEWVLADRAIMDPLRERLIEITSKVVLGLPSDSKTTMGPLHNAQTVTKVTEHVEEAKAKGARVLRGGEVADGFPTKNYYQPTVMDQVDPGMMIAREETFGPVIPITDAADIASIVELANQASYGLTASIFTNDLQRAFHLAEALPFGEVVVNEGSRYWEPHIPVGGWCGSQSGIGRLGGRYTFDVMTNTKTLVIDVGPSEF